MKKIAIYGGTFSPPHIGHVGAAEAFARAVSPDELLIIPDFLPPHKVVDNDATAEDRLEMCRLAFSHIKNVTVSDIEIRRGGKSYTAITLTELSSPDRELYFLLGTDMLLTLDTWYDFRTIFKLATICYVRRESDCEISMRIDSRVREYTEKYGAKIIPISADVIEVSSSTVRKGIQNRENVEKYISPSVRTYIEKKGLYT